MPKKSGLTDRDVVNHGNGKGDKTRVTDVKAYRANFDEINWGRPHAALRPDNRMIPIIHRFSRTMTLREIDAADEEFAWRHGL